MGLPVLERTTLRLGLILVGLVAAAVLIGKFLVPTLDRADLSVATSIAGSRDQPTIDLAGGVSQLGSTPTLLILTAVAVIGLIRVKEQVVALFVAVSTLGGMALYQSAKYLVQRPRPPLSVRTADLTSFSFPSGHATGAICTGLGLALVLTLVVRSRWQAVTCVAVVISVLVAASRVYLGLHYVSDVVVGLGLGAVWTLACLHVLLSDHPHDR